MSIDSLMLINRYFYLNYCTQTSNTPPCWMMIYHELLHVAMVDLVSHDSLGFLSSGFVHILHTPCKLTQNS